MVETMQSFARDALTRANAAVSAAALSAVRPIYRNIGTRPEHLGTVTFVELDGQDYILTAAHVVDHHKAHTLYIGNERLQDLTLTFRATKAPGGDRSKDPWDFAFATADPAWREHGIMPLSIGNLPSLDDALVFTAVGYPNSANRKVDHQSHRIEPTQRRHASLRLPRDHHVYSALPITPDTHVAISREKYGIYGGQRVRAFEPRGMSGGAFFGLLDVHMADVAVSGRQPAIFPAGLITERRAEHRAMFGPSFAVIANQIRANPFNE